MNTLLLNFIIILLIPNYLMMNTKINDQIIITIVSIIIYSKKTYNYKPQEDTNQLFANFKYTLNISKDTPKFTFKGHSIELLIGLMYVSLTFNNYYMVTEYYTDYVFTDYIADIIFTILFTLIVFRFITFNYLSTPKGEDTL